jgi:molybdopterin molybdotransferase
MERQFLDFPVTQWQQVHVQWFLPSQRLMFFSGREWLEPLSFNLPANFSKLKKAGRREFLRARIRNSKVDVFQSEGSGRVSGLSWAEGFVDLPEQELSVLPGDFVKYIPFSSYMD